MEAPLPLNEEARLAKLASFDILDTLPEATYDDITRLACSICRTPIALVTLIDRDRQWFKSKVGLDVVETPRASFFCSHAILQPQQTLIVPDATQDQRFAQNPFVQGEPHIRFYAGAPLVTADGHALGTLCVADHKPRHITPEQEESLQALARQVMVQLELCQSQAELRQKLAQEQSLREQAERFYSVAEHGMEMIALLSAEGTYLYLSPAVTHWLGYNPEELVSHNAFSFIHPDDVLQVQEVFGEVLTSVQVKTGQFRFRAADGQWHWIESVATNMLERPSVHAIVINSRDITERKRAEEAAHERDALFQALLESFPSGSVNVFDRDLRYMLATGKGLEEVGLRSEMLVGKTLAQLYPKEQVEYVESFYRRALSGEDVQFDLVHGGQSYLLYASPLRRENNEINAIVVIAHNITQRKQAEELLREREERFRRIFEEGPMGIALMGLDGHLAEVNTRLCDMLGYSVQELKSCGITGITHPEDLDTDLHMVQQLFAGEVPFYHLEKRYLTKERQVVWGSLTVTLIHDEEGQPRYALGILEDITESKQVQAQLRFQKALLEAQMETSLDGILVVSDDGEILTFNQRFVQLWDIPLSLVNERNDQKALQEVLDKLVDPQQFLERVSYLYHHRDEQSHEEVALRDGRIFDRYSAPVVSSDGTYYGRVWFFRDITERKQTEASLLNSEAELRTLVESMPQIVWMTRPDGWHTHFNQKWLDYTGLTLEESLGHGWNPPFHPEDRPRAAKRWQEATHSGEPYEIEYRLRRADGVYRWMLGRALPLRDTTGLITKWFGTCTDIHDQKQAAAELKTHAVQLERSNRQLEEFAYVASHDLQEPLRTIKAFGEQLQRKYSEVLDEKGQDYVERIQGAAVRMQTLIKDLLELSRISTQVQPFVKVDLAQITRDVVSDLETRIAQTGAQVTIGELPQIEADPLQMRQLLQNLISNALKFHPIGGIPVVVVGSSITQVQEDVQEDLRGEIPSMEAPCHLIVQDNGIGFDEKYLERIFAPFQRLHGRSQYEGTGMGLAICRKIVERHNGHITAKSSPGHGTTFVVTLPVRP